MYIEALTNIKSGVGLRPTGELFYCPDDEAFSLIDSGVAKPANRSSRKLFEQMKAKQPAPLPEGPDIRDQFVSAPKDERPSGGRFNFSSGSVRAR